MTPLLRRSLLWGAGILVLVLVLGAGFRFPWGATAAAVTGADPAALAALVVVALLCLMAKAWAWHLLLRPVAPHRFWSAQDANFVGTAVNNLAVAVIGEAARVRRLRALEPTVPFGTAIASVVWTRALEGVGLAVFVLTAPMVVQLPPILRGAEIGAATVLIVLGGLIWFRGWAELPAGFPEPIRRAAVMLGQIGPWHRLAAPALLALINWIGQWAAFYFALVAAGIAVPPEGSLVVMLLTNLATLLRLTPAGVGATQAAFIAGLLPFHVSAAQAIGASLLFQAAQILPVMALALALVGWNGLGDLLKPAPAAPAEKQG